MTVGFPDPENLGSQHMILAHPAFTRGRTGNVSPAKWLWDAVHGEIGSYGLQLLK
ncbi:MAG: hypothetical protein NC548_55385 [Lachnospiraceae bacterium]|nr:hypothetical protein [Lachnospiraceae bacterium]